MAVATADCFPSPVVSWRTSVGFSLDGHRLVINAVVGLFFGSAAYYCALLYTASCAVVFMARTLSNLVPEQAQHGGRSEHRNHLLAGCATKATVLETAAVVLAVLSVVAVVLAVVSVVAVVLAVVSVPASVTADGVPMLSFAPKQH